VDSRKASKDEAILTSVAESIGSTLGTIAAKAGAVQKVLTDKVAHAKPRMRRAAKRVVRTAKKRSSPRMKRARKRRAALSSRGGKRKL
jgi:hypothetical protein